MEPLTLTGAIIGILAAIAGIIAAIVQVREYREKRREKPEGPGKEDQPLTPPGVPQIPHNLPPRSEFIGRESEKARVHEALRSRSYLVSIDGIGGIGKTSLALEVAHECLRASKREGPADGIAAFNGIIWTTAKDRDLTLNALLDTIARTLEYPGIAQQPLEEKRLAVRKLLQAKPYLLIVDNFETITDDSVRDFLIELPEPSKTLLTTREQKLRQVRAISLKGLTESEALALIRNEGKRLGLASLEHAEGWVLLHLYQATGGTPLAIKWAVGQIKQKGQSLDTVLASLHEARGSIFDSIFTRSWALLSASARQVLIVTPIFATSASREGIEATSDVHHFVLDEALGQLVEMSLVDATDELDLTRRRYSIHPLTRAFATSKVRQEPEGYRAAQQRLAGFYQSFTKEHGGFWYRNGLARLEPELPNILATVQWCRREHLSRMGLDILHNVLGFILIHGYWADVLGIYPPTEFVVHQVGEMGYSLSSSERSILERACEVAVSLYENRTRRSGDPYVSHAIAVGLITAAVLKGEQKDARIVAAALTHDVNYVVGPDTLAQVGRVLGSEVQTLVKEASKLGESIEEQELGHILRSFSMGAILIRLADRLHNMQTMRFTPRHKWQRLVEETENLYIPLARQADHPDIVKELERITREARQCLLTAA